MLRGLGPLTDRVVVGRVGKPHGLDGSFVVDDASEDGRAGSSEERGSRYGEVGPRSSRSSAPAAGR